jgi:hypothetical protein
VIRYSVTASTKAAKQMSSESTIATRTSVACWLMPASFATIPSPLVARPNRTIPVTPAAM